MKKIYEQSAIGIIEVGKADVISTSPNGVNENGWDVNDWFMGGNV